MSGVDRREFPLALAGVLAGLLWCVAPLLTGRSIVSGDVALYDLPRLELLAGWLRAGDLPGWCHLTGYGGPVLGDPGQAAGYPPYALLLLASPLATLHLLTAVHMGLAHAGVYVLARGRGLAPGGAFLAAAAWGLGGSTVNATLSPTALQSAAWVPWALAATQRALSGPPRLLPTLLAAAAFALSFLGGGPDFTLGGGLLALVLALADALPLRTTLPRLGLIVVLAAALASHVLLPFLAFLSETTRGEGLAYSRAGQWALRPVELLGLLVPGLGRELAPDPDRPWFTTLHLGTLPLAAALVALRRALGERRGAVLLGAIALLLLYATGPLHRLLWEVLPAVRAVRYPAKYAAPALLLLALLAGSAPRAGPRLGRALVALGALALLVAGVAAGTGRLTLAARALQPLGVAALGAVLCRRARPWRPLLALALLDLLLAGWLTLPLAPAAGLTARPALADAVARVEVATGQPERVVSTGTAWSSLPWQGEEARREALFPNAGAPAGVRTVQLFGAVVARRPLLLVEAAQAAPPVAGDPTRALAVMGARLVVTGSSDLAALPSSSVTVVAHVPPWVLLFVGQVPRWAQVLGRSEQVDGPEEALARLRRGELDPRQTCLVEGLPSLQGPAGEVGRVEVLQLGFDRLSLLVETPRPAVLLVREAWAPGWTATVDGVPAALVPADLAFRAVPVPPGRHRVDQVYVPPRGRAGALVAGAAWCGLLACLLVLRATHRPA